MRRWVWAVLGTVALVIGGVVFAVHWFVTQETRGRLEETQRVLHASFTKHRKQFEADVRWFAESDWYVAPRGEFVDERDAASFLNRSLSWNDLPPESTDGTLELKQWQDLPDAPSWTGLTLDDSRPDTGWLRPLLAFERWSLDRRRTDRQRLPRKRPRGGARGG